MQKEEQLLEKRLLELSKIAYHREIITYSDFLNLNELNILHTLPKDKIFTSFVTFGGYDTAERQMAAFLPDALCLRGESTESPGVSYEFPFSALCIAPLHDKYAESLSHRDYLGAIMNLGIERSKIGDILVIEKQAIVFIQSGLVPFLMETLVRVKHTTVSLHEETISDFQYEPKGEIIKGSVASVRLDSLLSLAFSSSRSKLIGLIEGAKVFVNGKLITTNSYQVKDEDLISVRGLGKFKYKGIISHTKKNRILVSVYKFI